MSEATFAAVDLGASSGRVMAGRVGPGTLTLDEVRRFANRPVRVNGTLHWDVLGLYGNVLDGLRAAPPGLVSAASTRGRSTTACWTRTATCSAIPSTTATAARPG
nr:hypothetical protein [Actinomadura madurae]